MIILIKCESVEKVYAALLCGFGGLLCGVVVGAKSTLPVVAAITATELSTTVLWALLTRRVTSPVIVVILPTLSFAIVLMRL